MILLLLEVVFLEWSYLSHKGILSLYKSPPTLVRGLKRFLHSLVETEFSRVLWLL